MKFIVSLVLSALVAGPACASPIKAARDVEGFSADAATFSGGAKWVKERNDAAFDADRVAGASSSHWVKPRSAKDAAFDVDAATFSNGAKWVKEREAEDFNVDAVTGAKDWIKRETEDYNVDAVTGAKNVSNPSHLPHYLHSLLCLRAHNTGWKCNLSFGA
jgi:hypothetical protein